MTTATISQKHQIVVPKKIREKLGLKAGTKITIYPLDHTRAVISKNPVDYVDALEGLGSEVWQKLGGAENYIKQERASWQKEK